MFRLLACIATRIGIWRSDRYTKKHFTALEVPFEMPYIYICNHCGAHHSSPGVVQHHDGCILGDEHA